MAEKVRCPVCENDVEMGPECPICKWQLESDYILGGVDERTRQEWEQRLQEARTQWQQQRSNPFGGDACLGITTNEEASILIDGHPVGETKKRYLLVENLKPGRHRVEARTRYASGSAQVVLSQGDVKQCSLELKRGVGFLRVLSELGVLTLEVDGKSFEVPARIEVEAGEKHLWVYGTDWFCLVRREVLPGQTVDVRIKREWSQVPNCIAILEKHSASVDRVAFSPDGRLLASGSGDGTVRLWQLGFASP